jgi:hypothetical protein
MTRLYLIFLVAFTSLSLCAQDQDSITPIAPIAGDEYLMGMFPKEEPARIRQLSVSGFYRFFSTYTIMDDPYLLDEPSLSNTPDRTLFIGDDSQLPNLWMNIAGRPTANTSFSMDVFMFQFLDANLGESYGTQTIDSLRPTVYAPRQAARLGGALGLNLGINLLGTYDTDIGSFTARMGGTHWYYLSDLTFASFRGYNRFTLFERNPWDPVQRSVTDRYDKFYKEGSTQQDLRWGNKAFHGLILEGASLPSDLSFSFLAGKTELNGGYNLLPNYSTGGRLRHDSDKGFQSFNSFNSRTYTDSLNKSSVGFNIHTLELAQDFADFKIHAELGGGRYYAPGYESGWGEALNVKVTTRKDVLRFPIELHAFRISPKVINNNAVFWNTSISEVNNNTLPTGVASVETLRPFASSIVPIGLMTNNRQGLNLNSDLEFGKLKIALGYGVSAEIEAVSNSITFSHSVNQLTRSRFWRWNFTPDMGPYQRYNVVYRDAYETVQLTDDVLGEVVNKKYFNTAEIQAKYNTEVFGKELYFFFLGRYASVAPEFHALMPLNETAYVRQYSNELEIYFQASKKVMITNYLGYERILGNYATQVDELSRRPRNQEGIGLGTGLDLSLGKNALFALRHRYFQFEDRSFSLDKFSGQETMVEIKVFF